MIVEQPMWYSSRVWILKATWVASVCRSLRIWDRKLMQSCRYSDGLFISWRHAVFHLLWLLIVLFCCSRLKKFRQKSHFQSKSSELPKASFLRLSRPREYPNLTENTLVFLDLSPLTKQLLQSRQNGRASTSPQRLAFHEINRYTFGVVYLIGAHWFSGIFYRVIIWRCAVVDRSCPICYWLTMYFV